MSKLMPWRRKPAELVRDQAEPNPLWALAIGLVYVFRTGPGHRILRDLEGAIRTYSADPSALWKLVKSGEEVIETTATTVEEARLRGAEHKTLPPK